MTWRNRGLPERNCSNRDFSNNVVPDSHFGKYFLGQAAVNDEVGGICGGRDPSTAVVPCVMAQGTILARDDNFADFLVSDASPSLCWGAAARILRPRSGLRRFLRVCKNPTQAKIGLEWGTLLHRQNLAFELATTSCGVRRCGGGERRSGGLR